MWVRGDAGLSGNGGTLKNGDVRWLAPLALSAMTAISDAADPSRPSLDPGRNTPPPLLSAKWRYNTVTKVRTIQSEKSIAFAACSILSPEKENEKSRSPSADFFRSLVAVISIDEAERGRGLCPYGNAVGGGLHRGGARWIVVVSSTCSGCRRYRCCSTSSNSELLEQEESHSSSTMGTFSRLDEDRRPCAFDRLVFGVILKILDHRTGTENERIESQIHISSAQRRPPTQAFAGISSIVEVWGF